MIKARFQASLWLLLSPYTIKTYTEERLKDSLFSISQILFESVRASYTVIPIEVWIDIKIHRVKAIYSSSGGGGDMLVIACPEVILGKIMGPEWKKVCS